MNEEIKLPKLSELTIDAVRDLSMQFESTNYEIAQELMFLAHLARPHGTLIKEKLIKYNEELNSRAEVQLKKLISSGELAIIPVGFRCGTKIDLYKRLSIGQQSLPFDSGFFPPAAVASVIKSPVINLRYPDDGLTHQVCLKYEGHMDSVMGLGIKFQKSTYKEINTLVVNKDMEGINKYLDTTFGYYTLDLQHNFVLAHYNWHEFAEFSYSKGVSDPTINIAIINDNLNRRIERMFSLCNSARYIFFVFEENQNYKYMMVDDYIYDLHNLNDIANAVKDVFKAECFVIKSAEIDTAKRVLEIINGL
jgi:hypothetical protein